MFLCRPVRSQITTQSAGVWVRSVSFGGHRVLPCAHTSLQSEHCENKPVPTSLNSSHQQQSHNCQFHAWLIVITPRETKKQREIHFRIKMGSETSLKSRFSRCKVERSRREFFCTDCITVFSFHVRQKLAQTDPRRRLSVRRWQMDICDAQVRKQALGGVFFLRNASTLVH